MKNGHVGRALFVFDPDGNEAEFNTRYLYRPVWCGYAYAIISWCITF